MNRIKAFSIVISTMMVLALLFAAGCWGGNGVSSESSTPTAPQVTKPKPSVESVNAISTGTQDKYYAILEVTVKNDGADGMIVLSGSITQGNQTIKNELPVYITHNTEEVVRLIFPLTWKGGDWVPKVEVQVP